MELTIDEEHQKYVDKLIGKPGSLKRLHWEAKKKAFGKKQARQMRAQNRRFNRIEFGVNSSLSYDEYLKKNNLWG